MENNNAGEDLTMENNKNEYIRRFRQELLEKHIIADIAEDVITIIGKGRRILAIVRYPILHRIHIEIDKIAFSLGLNKIREGSVKMKASGFYSSIHVYEPSENMEIGVESNPTPNLTEEKPIPVYKRKASIYCPTVTPPRGANCYAE